MSSLGKSAHISRRTSTMSSAEGAGPRSAHKPSSDLRLGGRWPSMSRSISGTMRSSRFHFQVRRIFSTGGICLAKETTCSKVATFLSATSNFSSLYVFRYIKVSSIAVALQSHFIHYVQFDGCRSGLIRRTRFSASVAKNRFMSSRSIGLSILGMSMGDTFSTAFIACPR